MNGKNFALASVFLVLFSSVVLAAPSTIVSKISYENGYLNCYYKDGTQQWVASAPVEVYSEGKYINGNNQYLKACLQAALQKQQSGQTLNNAELLFYDIAIGSQNKVGYITLKFVDGASYAGGLTVEYAWAGYEGGKNIVVYSYTKVKGWTVSAYDGTTKWFAWAWGKTKSIGRTLAGHVYSAGAAVVQTTTSTAQSYQGGYTADLNDVEITALRKGVYKGYVAYINDMASWYASGSYGTVGSASAKTSYLAEIGRVTRVYLHMTDPSGMRCLSASTTMRPTALGANYYLSFTTGFNYKGLNNAFNQLRKDTRIDPYGAGGDSFWGSIDKQYLGC